MNVIDQFYQQVRDKEDDNTVTPILQYGDITFVFIKYRDLYSILYFVILLVFVARLSDSRNDDQNKNISTIKCSVHCMCT